MSNRDKKGARMKLVVLSFVVGVFSLNLISERPESAVKNISKYEITLAEIGKIMEIEEDRRQVSRKVGQIIDRFNPDMDAATREEIIREIYDMSQRYDNLDIDLICATITHESGRTWDPTVISNAGAMGLMQIMPETGLWLSQYEDIRWTEAEDILYDPVYNIRMGCRYLSALIESYDLEGGLAAYNGGERIVRKWLASNKAKGILWDETRDYIPFVLKLYDEFKSYTM